MKSQKATGKSSTSKNIKVEVKHNKGNIKRNTGSNVKTGLSFLKGRK